MPRGIAAVVVPLILLWTASTATAQEIRVGVDPRVELMNILFRLAGNDEYKRCRVPAYDKAIEQRFAPFRDHQAVLLARSLGIRFFAPTNLGVHVKDVQTLAEVVPFDRPDIRLFDPWNVGQVRDFLSAVKVFEADTKFQDFLRSQQPLYNTTNARAHAVVQGIDLAWFGRFFGMRPPGRFVVVPAVANGTSSYACRTLGGDGVGEYYSVPSVWKVDAQGLPLLDSDWRNTTVHQFSHLYANPAVDKFGPRLERAARQMYQPVAGAMQGETFNNWKVMMYEYVVRAATIEYVLEHDGPEAGAKLTGSDKEHSFFWINELVELMGQYQLDRKQYPTFESFMPRLVEFFDKVAPPKK